MVVMEDNFPPSVIFYGTSERSLALHQSQNALDVEQYLPGQQHEMVCENPQSS